MAKFYEEPAPTNDPNYGGASKGYGEVKANTGIGDTLKGVAGLVEGGAKGLYTVADASIKDEIRAAVEPIRARHGADVLPGDAPAIAGTGARGAKYAVAQTDDLAADPALPEQVKAGIDTAKRYKQAFDQGALSDTKYSSELERVVQNMRSKYPEWKDEIDKHVSEITGQTPANALRASVLRDLVSQSASTSAQVKRDEAWVQHHWESILFAYPNATQAQAVANVNGLKNDPKINALVARKAEADYMGYGVKVMEGSIKVKTEASEGWLRTEGSRILSGYITGAAGGLNLNQIMANGIKDPKTFEAALPVLHQAKAGVLLAIKRQANHYDPSNPKSQPASRFLGEKVDKIAEEAAAPLQNIIDLITKGEADKAALLASLNKVRLEGDVRLMSEKYKVMRAGGAMKVLMGETTLGSILAKDLAGQRDVLQTILGGSWLEVHNTGDPNPPLSLPDALATGGKEKLSQSEFRQVVQTMKNTVIQAKDPVAAERAIHFLHSEQSTFAALPAKAQMQHFVQTASPDVSQRVAQLSPVAQRQYYGSVNNMFLTTFRTGMADLQSVVQDKEYVVTQDPKTLQFAAVPTAGPRPFNSQRNTVTGEGRPGKVDPIQEQLDKVNYGIALMLPVLKQTHPGQEASRLSQLLGAGGVDFSSPKNPGIAAVMGQAVITAMQKGGDQAVKDAEDQARQWEENKAQNSPLPSAYPGAMQYDQSQSAPGLATWLAAHGNVKKEMAEKAKKEISVGDASDFQVSYGPITVTNKDGRKYTVEGTPENIARFMNRGSPNPR